MHKGPVKLGTPLRARCLSLISLGTMINIFTIDVFIAVMEVNQRIRDDKLYMHDLQDLVRLGKAIQESEMVGDQLKEDIEQLLTILGLFIQAASVPTRSCAMWMRAAR